MPTFQHSIVLFSGDDGLPLEFNIRNTKEKALLKDMIEYGGGLCSQSENAVHLISPGTKVLNADLGKKLVSSRYIFDCVKDNYLLDVNDYVFTISEAKTSDISEDESENLITTKPFVTKVERLKTLLNFDEDPIDLDIDVDPAPPDGNNKTNSTHPSPAKTNLVQNTSVPSSTESFIVGSIDFELNPKISAVPGNSPEDKPLTSTAKEPDSVNIENDFNQLVNDCSPIQGSASLVQAEAFPPDKAEDNHQVIANPEIVEYLKSPLPVHTVVSSSQQFMEDLDQFDNLLLDKIQQKHQPDSEECLSQSYTVSSSADAQVASKPTSVEGNSAEIFADGIPDSPTLAASLALNRHLYIQKLEPEIEKILQKPSPKSLQDKISLVKYICCVKKLPPSVVLASLGSL